jgi:hypothetical protein
VTLWRWLQLAAAGLVQVEGRGRRTDPFRYWLPAAEARWRQDPLYELLEQQYRDLKLPFESLRDKKRKRAAQPDLDREWNKPLPKNAKLWPPGSPVE